MIVLTYITSTVYVNEKTAYLSNLLAFSLMHSLFTNVQSSMQCLHFPIRKILAKEISSKL